MTTQFLRKASLIITNPSTGRQDVPAIDLSEMGIKFQTQATDGSSPNTLLAQIYNLSEQTQNLVQNEFRRVILQAGYEGPDANFATIFDGTITRFRKGKVRNVDSFLEIHAATFDEAFNFATVSDTLKAGTTAQQRVAEICRKNGIILDPSVDQSLANQGGVLPRGKVLFGMARSFLHDVSNTANARWSFQNGKLVMVPATGYLPGTVIQLNSSTGMIGIPTADDGGVHVVSLLNPNYQIGQRIQINNKDINQTRVIDRSFNDDSTLALPAYTTSDGYYRVLVIEHSGDTRGNDWYSNLTCLNLDPTKSDLTAARLASGTLNPNLS